MYFYSYIANLYVLQISYFMKVLRTTSPSLLSSQGGDVSTETSALSTDMEKQFRARRWPFPEDQRRLLGWLVLCLPCRSEQGPPDG